MNTDSRFLIPATIALVLAAGCVGSSALDSLPEKPANVPPLETSFKSREQVVAAFAEREYGVRRVERPSSLRFENLPDVEIMNGMAIHRAVRIHADGPRAPFSFMAHAYFPKGADNLGTFLLVYIGQRVKKDRFDPDDPNPSRDHLPVERILKRGYAAVMFNNWDVAMDSVGDCFTTGVFRAWGPSSPAERTGRDWGAISAWAWGASRVMDWIETQDVFDAQRVAVVGHSRGGKTALWTAATDTRFALACVNDSGCSGAKLNHLRLPKSESISVITTVFPHWFCRNYQACGGCERTMDFDQHSLLSCVAPRALAVASATLDNWAGQEGEFASCALASPAWEAFGKPGLIAPQGFPAPDRPLSDGWVSYHLRTGIHTLAEFDWDSYMNFADRRMPAVKTFDVRDFGAKGDGTALDTAAIQRAVDAAEKAGGGTVRLRRGTYLSGTVHLKDNVTLRLGDGAVLKGCTNREEYCAADFTPQNWASSKKGDNTSGGHLVVAVGRKNVAIVGPGKIDGSGAAFLTDVNGRQWKNWKAGIPWRPGQMVWICDCEGVRLLDVELADSPYWTCNLLNCDNVDIRGCRIHNERRSFKTWNGDGIDVDRCRYVTIRDCDIDTTDDCITLRASCADRLAKPKDCEQVWVSNCRLASSCNAIRLGVGEGRIHDALFSEIDIRDTRNAINFVAAYSPKNRGTDIDNILMRDFTVEAEQFLHMYHRHAEVAVFRDIEFLNMRGTAKRDSVIEAKPTMPFGNIRFVGVDIPTAAKVTNADISIYGGSISRSK